MRSDVLVDGVSCPRTLIAYRVKRLDAWQAPHEFNTVQGG